MPAFQTNPGLASLIAKLRIPHTKTFYVSSSDGKDGSAKHPENQAKPAYELGQKIF